MKRSDRVNRDAQRAKPARDRTSGVPPAMAPAEFASLIAAFAGEPGVTHGGKGFGSSGLKVNGKLFAMPVEGRLVLKLPRARVERLVAAGEGTNFDPGHGRPMKEWVVLDWGHADRLELARVACGYVRTGKG